LTRRGGCPKHSAVPAAVVAGPGRVEAEGVGAGAPGASAVAAVVAGDGANPNRQAVHAGTRSTNTPASGGAVRPTTDSADGASLGEDASMAAHARSATSTCRGQLARLAVEALLGVAEPAARPPTFAGRSRPCTCRRQTMHHVRPSTPVQPSNAVPSPPSRSHGRPPAGAPPRRSRAGDRGRPRQRLMWRC